jgi:hypothetical protein
VLPADGHVHCEWSWDAAHVWLWLAVFSIVRCGRCGGTGDPVALHPFATLSGMEWYGRSQGRVNQDRDLAGFGDRYCLDLVSWLRQIMLTPAAGWDRQRMLPSRSP